MSESLHVPQQGHLGVVLNQKLPRLEKSRPSRLGAPGTTEALPGSFSAPRTGQTTDTYCDLKVLYIVTYF
jgi:hypothetical protein